LCSTVSVIHQVSSLLSRSKLASYAMSHRSRIYTLSTSLWKQDRSQLTQGPGQGRPETCWRPGLANNLAPLKTDILFNLVQGWGKFLRTRAETADNFQRNSFAYANLSLLARYFRLFQRRGARVTARFGPPFIPALDLVVPTRLVFMS